MIPHIIHQIWETKDIPLPSFLSELSNSWKSKHPTWQYEFWDKKRMEDFVKENFPEYLSVYGSYIYDVQRWDVIRYMILYKMGGVYIDFDYECIESIENLLIGKSCCFGLEPMEHAIQFQKNYIITNAFIAVIPQHPFILQLLEQASSVKTTQQDKLYYVLETTGPFMINKVYENYRKKNNISLIPSEVLSPLSKNEVLSLMKGKLNEDFLQEKLNEAKAVHYFFSSWCK